MSDPTLPLLPFRNLLFPYGFCVVHFHLLVSRKGFGATNQRKDADLDHLKEDLGLSVRCVSHRVFVYPRSWRGLPSMCWRWQEKERTNTSCRRASASKWRTWKFVRLSLRLVESAVPCGSSKGRGHRVFAPLPVWVDSDCRQHKRKSDRRGVLADHHLLQRFHRSRQTPRFTVSASAGIHAVPAGDG